MIYGDTSMMLITIITLYDIVGSIYKDILIPVGEVEKTYDTEYVFHYLEIYVEMQLLCG